VLNKIDVERGTGKNGTAKNSDELRGVQHLKTCS
jgi:hypothetical protein